MPHSTVTRSTEARHTRKELIQMLSKPMTSICDRERLLQALDQTLSSWTTYAPYLDFFRRRLRCSRAVAAHQIPGDVITMNSRFALHDDRRGDTICCTL